MTPLSEFVAAFKPHLGDSRRWDAFFWIAAQLFNLGRPVHIGETGCIRQLDCWKGDGQSTRLWAFIVGAVGGSAFSIDIDPKACALARDICGDAVSIVEADSISFLVRSPALGNLDLLYLDSFDYTGDARSALHHAGELAAAYPKLQSGCLIAVDDCHSPTEGKHTLVKAFFDAMGIEPEVMSYITVWRKP